MIEAVLDTTGVVASIYGYRKVNDYHQKELEKSKENHEKIMAEAKEKHNLSMINTKKTYLLELFYSLDQHFLQLNADLISSGKESERDMFDQRSQNFQTLILAASVMFSALATVISQGYLPYTIDSKTIPVADSYSVGNITDSIIGRNHNATSVNYYRRMYVDPGIYSSYSLFCGLSFGALFLTVVISSEIIHLASEFMYRRDQRNSTTLRRALNETKKMMDNLMETNHDAIKTRTHREKDRQLVSSLNAEAVKDELEKHEKKIRTYLEQRNSLNSWLAFNLKAKVAPTTATDAAAVTVSSAGATARESDVPEAESTSDEENLTFEEYWQVYCSMWAIRAQVCFYCGTLALLVAILIFVWAQFAITYRERTAAFIAIGLVALSIILGVGLVVWFTWQNYMDFHSKKSKISDNDIGIGNDVESNGNGGGSIGNKNLQAGVACEEMKADDRILISDGINDQSRNLDSSRCTNNRRGFVTSSPITYQENPLKINPKSAENFELDEFKDSGTIL